MRLLLEIGADEVMKHVVRDRVVVQVVVKVVYQCDCMTVNAGSKRTFNFVRGTSLSKASATAHYDYHP
jgi:hypothetical protein